MFKKKVSTAVASGASAAPGTQPMVPAASVGNAVVAKHIKKQHVKHNKGMQIKGSAPATELPTMPLNPYNSQI